MALLRAFVAFYISLFSFQCALFPIYLGIRRRYHHSALPGFGGDKRNRTAGLLLARQALSQLSYTPINAPHSCGNADISLRSARSRVKPIPFGDPLASRRGFTSLIPQRPPKHSRFGVVGSSGLEPPTSRLSGARSNRLSYEPILVLPLILFCQRVFTPYGKLNIEET